MLFARNSVNLSNVQIVIVSDVRKFFSSTGTYRKPSLTYHTALAVAPQNSKSNLSSKQCCGSGSGIRCLVRDE
jgi:hypothetical protein